MNGLRQFFPGTGGVIPGRRHNAMVVALLAVVAALVLGACGGGATGTGTFTVGGTASGLTATLILQNNGADDLTVEADGEFSFAAGLEDGAPYAVTVLTQPTE